MADREQFLDFGGYPEIHRTYGGGEFYLDMKWWLFGSTVCVDPEAIAYHLSAPRGYEYHLDDYMHNVLAIGWALGMEDWAERAYLNWCRKKNLDMMKKIWEQVQEETQEDREFIAKKRKHTVNELLVSKPWDKLNDEKYGRHNSSMLVYHDTWLELIKGTPAEEMYKNAKYQKGLEKFIEENLTQYIYKRDRNKIRHNKKT
jgi:hypothetical protein